MKPNEMIAVIEAFQEGKPIEGSRKGMNDFGVACAPTWDFSCYDYRVKPEPPKPREWRVPSIILNSPDLLQWFTNPYSLEGDIHVREVLEDNSVPSD